MLIFVTINSNFQVMKKIIPALAFLLSIPLGAQNLTFRNSYEVSDDDTREIILDKAVHVVPGANQLRALEDGFIAFIHFGPNTFTGMEWGTGKEDPSVFALKSLDTDQWCRAIRDAGMKTVILTVKHHDGFVLWQSRYTRHGIMSTDFLGGQGDVLASLSKSCRKYGLRLGVYLSPADLYQIESPDGLYGNLSEYSMREIPRRTEGRPFADTSVFHVMTDDYNEYFMNQLFEILTEYGPVHEVWFDGAHPKRKGGQRYNYEAWETIIHRLAPEAVIFGRADLRWCGNEAGATRKEEWNVVAYPEKPSQGMPYPDLTDDDLGSRDRLYASRYICYQPAETNTSIREGWFYRDDETQQVRSADDVFDIYERAVGGNSVFLLNIPPNKEGRLSDRDVAVLKEVGRRIRKTYGKDLFRKAVAPEEIIDGCDSTYVTVEEGGSILISLPSPVTFNRLMLGEAVGKMSERVEHHKVEAYTDGEWRQIAEGPNIGFRRILRFPTVTADSIRVTFDRLRAPAAIAEISAHYYKAGPPMLYAERDMDGNVTIGVSSSQFGWKPHGENASENLSPEYEIFYTVDGSRPDRKSQKYEGPFKADDVELKAVACSGGRYGALLSERIGHMKSSWTLSAEAVSATDPAAAADEDQATVWAFDFSSGKCILTVDLGDVRPFSGFEYVPSSERGYGLLERGEVSISEDGMHWEDKGEFFFGNIVNDPSPRTWWCGALSSARCVRISVTAVAGSTGSVAVAEINVFGNK